MAGVLLFSGLIVLVALGIGVVGYMHFGHMGWIDGLLNASMILTGMGPVEPEKLEPDGKLFASAYALFSGLLFISLMGIVLAPVAHRMLHKFHLDEKDLDDDTPTQS
jgi:hypothetical protein